MSTILTDVDSWVIALVLALAMFTAWGLGRHVGRRAAQAGREAPGGKLSDAIVALLGLLLAFTFSMSLGKHDQRRQSVVTDSNAIGDFYTCASLVKEPTRGQLQDEVQAYTEQRLALAQTWRDEALLQVKLGEMQQRHNRLQALVQEAVDGGTPIAIPLVNTLNEVTSSHAARLAATRDRLPASIVVLLFLAAVATMALVGRQQGQSGEHHLGALLLFVALVSMVVWVTLDLNQPQRGLITVSQEPLQRLLMGMGR
jgi:hypothetical protein